MYIRILDTDDWVVEYDIENNIYRVSYFQDYHFVDEVLFLTILLLLTSSNKTSYTKW